MLGDDGQQHARGRVRARPALLPVSERGRRETELCRELRLAEPHLRADLSYVYMRHMHQRHADVIVVAARPGNRLLQSLDDARANGGPS